MNNIDRALSTMANDGMPVIPANYQPRIEPIGKTYIHGGSEVFDRQSFRNVYNSGLEKPGGGFWASATDAKHSWIDWRAAEGYPPYSPQKQIQFTIAPQSRIFRIESVDDIAYLIANYPQQTKYPHLESLGVGKHAIDWPAVALDWDGISYDYSTLGNALGPMDCDCIAIFNPDIVQCINPQQDISRLQRFEDMNMRYQDDDMCR